jgi:Phage integrase, N-terminal SAM-like domain
MAAPSVDDLARSFERYLRAGNKSPRTVETYLEALAGFSAHLAGTSKRRLHQASREDVETWIALLLGRWKPSTAQDFEARRDTAVLMVLPRKAELGRAPPILIPRGGHQPSGSSRALRTRPSTSPGRH